MRPALPNHKRHSILNHDEYATAVLPFLARDMLNYEDPANWQKTRRRLARHYRVSKWIKLLVESQSFSRLRSEPTPCFIPTGEVQSLAVSPNDRYAGFYLERMNRVPSLIYQPLGSSMIRLLQIKPSSSFSVIDCDVVYMNLDSPVPYTALSWRWDSDRSTLPIIVNGNTLDISGTLFSALLHLRKRQVSLLWVDYICINQQDLEERASQVQLMQDVYQRATNVAVWLGDGNELSSRAFDDMHGMLTHLDFESIVASVPDWAVDPDYTAHGPKTWEAMSDVLSYPWFRRVWILQEVIAAKHAVILCGNDCIKMEQFLLIVRAIFRAQTFGSIMSFHPRPAELDVSKIRTIRTQLQFILDAHYGSGAFLGHRRYVPRLLNILSSTRGAEATDPRDKVYGILGLSKLHNSEKLVDIEVDYHISTDRLSINVTKAIISKTRSLEVLHFAARRQSENVKLPSWVPNWANNDPQCAPLGKLRESPYYAGHTWSDNLYLGSKSDTAAEDVFEFTDNDTLAVEGIQVDVVTRVSMHGLEDLVSRIMDEGSSTDVVAHIETLTQLLRNVQLCCENWATMAARCSPYASGQSVEEVLWSSLDATVTESSEKCSSLDQFLDRIQTVQSMLRSMKDLTLKGFENYGETELEDLFSRFKCLAGPVLDVAGGIVLRGALMTTKTKRFGFVPTTARRGDIIFALLGSEEHVLLRRNKAKTFQFLGHVNMAGVGLGDLLQNSSLRKPSKWSPNNGDFTSVNASGHLVYKTWKPVKKLVLA